jgi:hypothetical protein
MLGLLYLNPVAIFVIGQRRPRSLTTVTETQSMRLKNSGCGGEN